MPWRNDKYPTGTILIVDDWPANVNLLCRILSAKGHTLYTATGGQEALDLIHTVDPDVILLDIQMPDMDGFEVCRRLKAADDTSDIPIIFISALTDTDGIVKGLRLGAADYVTKPFKLEEICARVENQIAMVRQRQEIERLHARERRQFEMLDRMKTEFVQMATHDLKNPLGVVQGYTYVLKKTISVAPEHAQLYEEGMAGIEHGVEKMKTLVTDILDLAQAQVGTDLELAPVPVAGFISNALKGFSLLAQQKEVTLRVSLPPDDVYWAVSQKRMARVVDNLVSNAIKYTPSGGCVDIVVELTAQNIILRVRDTGLGIPADDLPRLFEAFFRVHTPEHRSVEGTGLGLSVVKSIVEQHQGEITVESELGVGSVFSIILPHQDIDYVVDDIPDAIHVQPEMELTS